ncbi:hypothetical protein [Rhodoferax sp. U11-2br]|nr:hypothetical protein [Rhodoferax sp. U11-2br]
MTLTPIRLDAHHPTMPIYLACTDLLSGKTTLAVHDVWHGAEGA